MQRIEHMTLGEGIIGAVAATMLGWFTSSFTRASRSEFKDLVARVATLERDRITREEFERDMTSLRELIREFRSEIRADMREIKAKV